MKAQSHSAQTSTAQASTAHASWVTGGDARAKLLYYDRHFQRDAVKLLPGEFYTSGDDIAIVTVLGSCVSACLRDVENGMGGMNHFMLPAAAEMDGVNGDSARYGNYAMELLVNDLLKRGARRNRLEAKVFGGGKVLTGFSATHVGARNVSFVREYLQAEHIPIAAEDLGDVYARKVCFLPRSGQAFMRRIESDAVKVDIASESAYGKRLRAAPVEGAVELFT